MHVKTNNSDIRPKAAPILDIRYLWTLVACVIAMLLAGMIQSPKPFISVSYYLPLHLVLELSSVVVSFAVAATAWYGFGRTRESRELVICLTFLFTGLIDLIHTLSYKGMPDFLTINDTGTAAGYWLLGRVAVGIGSIIAVFAQGRMKSRWTPVLLIVGVFALTISILKVIVANSPAFGLLFFDEVLTPLKVGTEYAIIILYTGLFFLISGRRGWGLPQIALLRQALILAIFCELAFTRYLSPYGLFNALGHLFKTVSYYFILKALFASVISKPYEQLADTHAELQSLYDKAQEYSAEIRESILRIGNALSSSLDRNQALEQIAGLVSGIFKSDCTIVTYADQKNPTIKIAAYSGDGPKPEYSADTTLNICRDVIINRESAIVDAAEHLDPDSGKRYVVCAPMIHANKAIGAITLYTDSRDSFVDEDIKLLDIFASQAAVAISNAMSYELESRVAYVLQNALLSTSSPETNKFQAAHVYKPAVDGTMIGGDFYDIIDLGDGKIGFTVGDVSGKGVDAAVHTAMVKYSLRAHLKACQSPLEVISMLDRTIMEQTADSIFMTMFFGILDLESRELTYVNAGHEPPVLLANGVCSTIDATGPVLGIGMGSFESGSIRVDSGSLLLLYTDGVSEARTGKEMFGTDRIRHEMVAASELDLHSIVMHIQETALKFAGGEFKDDVAIMAIKVT